MRKYHMTYRGPSHMPETDEEMAAMMQGWQTWFGMLGASLIDPGAPFGPRQTIAADGSVSDAGGSNGYSVIEANDLADAIAKAKGCPVLGLGSDNTVEVSECIDM